MSETKWIEGPWYATTRKGSWDWVVARSERIEICQPFHDGTDENEIGEANAHLIAAAPDLYDGHEENARALSLLLADLRGRVDESKLAAIEARIEHSRVLMAKARGPASKGEGE